MTGLFLQYAFNQSIQIGFFSGLVCILATTVSFQRAVLVVVYVLDEKVKPSNA